MRYCKACGEPIGAHERLDVPVNLAAQIMRDAPHPAIARARLRHAGRVCPLARVEDTDAWRPYRLVPGYDEPEDLAA
jgi:hypothetical protein